MRVDTTITPDAVPFGLPGHQNCSQGETNDRQHYSGHTRPSYHVYELLPWAYPGTPDPQGRDLKSSLTSIQVAVLLSQCRQVPKGW